MHFEFTGEFGASLERLVTRDFCPTLGARLPEIEPVSALLPNSEISRHFRHSKYFPYAAHDAHSEAIGGSTVQATRLEGSPTSGGVRLILIDSVNSAMITSAIANASNAGEKLPVASLIQPTR
jgi:hypothetical protein